MKHIVQNLLLNVLVVAGIMAPVQAAPTFITTAQGQGGDVAVRGGNFASSNFGNLDILRLRNAAALGDARKIYLHFDLKTLPESVKNVTGATLGLQIAPAEGKSPDGKVWMFNVSGLKDGTPDEKWDEKTVTWNNVPVNDVSSPLNLSPTVIPLGTFSVTGKGTVGQPIAFSSPQLQEFLRSDTDGLVTLIITRQEAGAGADEDVTHIFASKEYGTPAPPVLSVAFHGEDPALPDAQKWATLPAVTKPVRFAEEIDAFEAADRQNPPAKGDILFVGSSSIRLWKTLAQDFPNQKVLNRGFGGSYISESVIFADRIVTPYEPKMIVFYAGTNDLADKKTPETLLADYMAFVSKVRAKQPKVPIAFISVAPAPSRWGNVENIKRANALIADFSKLVPNLKFIDIFPLMLDAKGQPRPELFVEDQLHMKPEGYAIWTKAVAPYLPKP